MFDDKAHFAGNGPRNPFQAVQRFYAICGAPERLRLLLRAKAIIIICTDLTARGSAGINSFSFTQLLV